MSQEQHDKIKEAFKKHLKCDDVHLYYYTDSVAVTPVFHRDVPLPSDSVEFLKFLKRRGVYIYSPEFVETLLTS